jgi:spore maturation protein B
VIALLNAISVWLVPLFVLAVLISGWINRVAVFDQFAEGAKEGLSMVGRLFPFLLGMLVAINVLRASGALDAFSNLLSPLLNLLHWPAETLPLALLRPLSGSGAMAFTADLLQRYGPDSLIGMIASTMQGSTDTTLFIITVYFGSVGVKRIRHALAAGLVADLVAMLAAIWLCQLLF